MSSTIFFTCSGVSSSSRLSIICCTLSKKDCVKSEFPRPISSSLARSTMIFFNFSVTGSRKGSSAFLPPTMANMLPKFETAIASVSSAKTRSKSTFSNMLSETSETLSFNNRSICSCLKNSLTMSVLIPALKSSKRFEITPEP